MSTPKPRRYGGPGCLRVHLPVQVGERGGGDQPRHTHAVTERQRSSGTEAGHPRTRVRRRCRSGAVLGRWSVRRRTTLRGGPRKERGDRRGGLPARRRRGEGRPAAGHPHRLHLRLIRSSSNCAQHRHRRRRRRRYCRRRSPDGLREFGVAQRHGRHLVLQAGVGRAAEDEQRAGRLLAVERPAAIDMGAQRSKLGRLARHARADHEHDRRVGAALHASSAPPPQPAPQRAPPQGRREAAHHGGIAWRHRRARATAISC